jgi:hypothetical protein
VFHYSPRSCTQLGPYVSWVESLRPLPSAGRRAPQHLLLGKQDCLPQSAFLASAQYSGKLNCLFPDVFSYVSAFSAVDDDFVGASRTEDREASTHLHRGYPGLTCHLLPARLVGLDPQSELLRGHKVSEVIDASVAEMWATVEGQVADLRQGVLSDKQSIVDAAMRGWRAQISSRPEAILCESATNAITFLGTGCAQPSKYRNVSGIFVQLEGGGLLLDCGKTATQYASSFSSTM